MYCNYVLIALGQSFTSLHDVNHQKSENLTKKANIGFDQKSLSFSSSFIFFCYLRRRQQQVNLTLNKCIKFNPSIGYKIC